MRRALFITVLIALAACSQPKAPATVAPEAVKTQRETSVAALAYQLEAISYKATVTNEGEQVRVRIGEASVKELRRAICRPMGWPTVKNEMIRFVPTLQSLRESGVTRIKIISDTENLDVELRPDGKCLKSQ